MKGFLFSVFFSLQVLLNAQVSFVVGKERDVERTIHKLIGADETGIYALRTSSVGSRHHVMVEKYSPVDARFVFSTEIDSEELQSGMKSTSSLRSINAFLCKGKVMVFFEVYDKKKDLQKLMLQAVMTSGELSVLTEIAERDLKPTGDPKLYSMFPNFFLGFTPDAEHFWVSPRSAVGTQYYEMIVEKLMLSYYGSKDLVKEFSLEVSVPGLIADNSIVTNMGFTNSGQFFLGSCKGGTLGGYAGVYVIDRNSPTPKSIRTIIPDGEKLLKADYKVLKNGDIFLTSFTSSIDVPVDYKDIKVTLKRVAKETYSVVYENAYILTDLFPDTLIARFQKRISFDLLDVFESGNDLIVSAECLNFPFGSWTSRNPALLGFPGLSCMDILLIRLKESGKVSWAVNVPKSHIRPSVNPEFMHLRDFYAPTVFCEDDLIYVIYEENSANSTKSLDEPSASYSEVSILDGGLDYVAMVTVDPAGNRKKEIIWNDYEGSLEHWKSLPFRSGPTKQAVYFEDRKAKSDKFGILKIK